MAVITRAQYLAKLTPSQAAANISQQGFNKETAAVVVVDDRTLRGSGSTTTQSSSTSNNVQLPSTTPAVSSVTPYGSVGQTHLIPAMSSAGSVAEQRAAVIAETKARTLKQVSVIDRFKYGVVGLFKGEDYKQQLVEKYSVGVAGSIANQIVDTKALSRELAISGNYLQGLVRRDMTFLKPETPKNIIYETINYLKEDEPLGDKDRTIRQEGGDGYSEEDLKNAFDRGAASAAETMTNIPMGTPTDDSTWLEKNLGLSGTKLLIAGVVIVLGMSWLKKGR